MKTQTGIPVTGGSGGDSPLTARDTRMIEKAVRQGWDIPETVMRELPLRMLKITRSDDASPRNQVAAARVLVQMHGQNQADDPATQEVSVKHSIDWGAMYQRDTEPDLIEVQIEQAGE